MGFLDLRGLAADLGLALLHSVWQVALVAVALWGLLTLLHRASPGLRHNLAMVALALAVLWPTVAFRQARIARSNQTAVISRGPRFIESLAPTPDPTKIHAAFTVRVIEISKPLLPWLALLWGAGVTLLGVRLAGGWLWLQRLRDSTAPAPEWVVKIGLDLSRRMTLRLPILRIAEGVAGPFSHGLWQTMVVLPIACLGQMDARALEALLAHEFAHLRRQDFLLNALQSVAELILFHHPLAHWISAMARLERERCCDLAAVAVCGDARFYASVLDRIDDLRPPTGLFNIPAMPAPTSLALRAQGAPLMIRIRHLLGAQARPSAHTLLAALIVLAGLGLVAAAPFRDGLNGPAILVPASMLKQVDAAAVAEGIDPDLMRAMIQCESRYDPAAKSPLGAVGLMQLMPQTAARFGATDPVLVDQNLQAGAKYLRFLLDRYKGDTARAVTAYNAGENAVDRAGSVAPTEESHLYAKAVMNLYRAKAIQPTEGMEGVQIIQGRLSKQEDGTWILRMEGWVIGDFKAEIIQPGAGAASRPTRIGAARAPQGPYYSAPSVVMRVAPENGPLKIVFEDFGSKRKGEAVVPAAPGDFMLELNRQGP